MRASWTHAAMKYEYRASAECAKQSSAECLCQCLMQEFWWEILHRSSYAHQPVGIQCRLQAGPFPHDWTWPVTCNLLFLAVSCRTDWTGTGNCTKTSLLSGKHSVGVAIGTTWWNRSFVLWALQPSTFHPNSIHLVVFWTSTTSSWLTESCFKRAVVFIIFSSYFPHQFLCGTFGDLLELQIQSTTRRGRAPFLGMLCSVCDSPRT